MLLSDYMPLIKNGSETWFIAELLYNRLDDRAKKLEHLGAYSQVLVEIDSFLDDSLLDILVETMAEEAGLFAEELYEEKVLSGRKIAEILGKKKIVSGSYLKKLQKFKTGRNKVVHRHHHIFNLIKDDLDEYLEQVKKRNIDIEAYNIEREEAAKEKYNELKELGKTLLKETIEVLKRAYNGEIKY